MGAVKLWVRSNWRRHLGATVYLALVAALTATVVGASLQAARRSETSLGRFVARSRSYDSIVSSCPPGVDPTTIESQTQLIESCINDKTTEEFRQKLLGSADVEAATLSTFSVVGLLDASAPNGWGQLGLMVVTKSPGSASAAGHPIIVEGRMPRDTADDEIAVSETTGDALGIHAGDLLNIASWRQANIDAASDGTLRPETKPIRSRVTGVVRLEDDLQPNIGDDLTHSNFPGYLYAGPGWGAAHGGDLAGYGTSVAVRVRGGPDAVGAFNHRMEEGLDGWTSFVNPAGDVDLASIERAIEAERQAVLIFAAIAAIAGASFVWLAVLRQLRRELSDAPTLLALGMPRRDLSLASMLRSLAIAAPAALFAAIAMTVISPLGPVGLARRAEATFPIRFDVPVLVVMVASLIVLFGLVGLVAPFLAARTRQPTRRRPSRATVWAEGLGAVPKAGVSFARGGSIRAAIVVAAIGVAACIAAGTIVASFDRVIDEPSRYGAWWDVAVGQYSEPTALEKGVAAVRSNSSVKQAAGYHSVDDTGTTLDGKTMRLIFAVPYVGHPDHVMAEGRAPRSDDEIALGAATARRLGKGVGDAVRLRMSDPNAPPADLRVVGIAVLADPASTSRSAGDGALISASLGSSIVSGIPQSIAIKLDPRADRSTAIRSIVRDFPGSTRTTAPPPDLRNLGRIGLVPWYISILIAVLAIATVTHALATLLLRHRRDLAVFSTFGFTRRQLWGVGTWTGGAVAGVSIVIGVPLGLLVGDRLWRTISDRISIPSGSIAPWRVTILASVVAMLIAGLVAVVVTRRITQTKAATLLRAE